MEHTPAPEASDRRRRVLEALIEQQAQHERQQAAKQSRQSSQPSVPIWKRDEERARAKEAKIQAIAAQAEQAALGECTFAPTINSRSRELPSRRRQLSSPTQSTAAKVRRAASSGPYSAAADGGSFGAQLATDDLDASFTLAGASLLLGGFGGVGGGLDSLGALAGGLGPHVGGDGAGLGGLGDSATYDHHLMAVDVPRELLAHHRAAALGGPAGAGRVDAVASASAAAQLAAGAVRGAGGSEQARSRAASNASLLVSEAAAAAAGVATARSRAGSLVAAASSTTADASAGGAEERELARAVDAALAALRVPPGGAPHKAATSPPPAAAAAHGGVPLAPAGGQPRGGGVRDPPRAHAAAAVPPPPPAAADVSRALLEYELSRLSSAHAAELARVHETYQVCARVCARALHATARRAPQRCVRGPPPLRIDRRGLLCVCSSQNLMCLRAPPRDSRTNSLRQLRAWRALKAAPRSTTAG